MQVRFEVRDFGDEAAAMQALKEGRAPEEEYHLWGSITIEQPGLAPLVLRDDLSSLGPALCIAVPKALRRDGRASLPVGDWPTDFLFESRAGTVPGVVHLSGPRGEDMEFPQEELLAGLSACGERLRDFIQTLALTHPQFAFSGNLLAAHQPP